MTELRRVGIRGTGSFLPEKILSNEDLETMVDTSDEWITTRTGIKERRIIDDADTTSNLATRAAQRALDAAEMSAKDLDLILMATVTGDYPFPASACRVATKLGANNVGAVDLSAACSGFLYGLSLGCSQVAAGAAKNVLVIGAEALSRIVNYEDRGSCILFGDGAGCAVISSDFTRGEVLSSELYSDGNGHDILWIEAGGAANPLTPEGLKAHDHCMKVSGREVYKFAVNRFVELVKSQLERFPDEELGIIIPHQVNLRIIESARSRLGLPDDMMYTNLDRYGNTSAASIPIALDEAVRSGLMDGMEGKLVICCAFGAGLTWAASSLRW